MAIKALKGIKENGSGGLSKKYLEENYLTMQETYNSFASTYYEAIGAPSEEITNIKDLAVGENLTGAIIDVSQYVIGSVFQGTRIEPDLLYNKIIVGTPNADGHYLQLKLRGYNSANTSNSTIFTISLDLEHMSPTNEIINSIELLNCIFGVSWNSSSYVIFTTSVINQKKNTQIMKLDNIDFGIITQIILTNPGYLSVAFDGTNFYLSPTVPEELVNLPYLRSKIGYEVAAEITLGEAGDYTSDELWLRADAVVRNIEGVIDNGTIVKPIAAADLSFNPSTKIITVHTDEDLTGYSARVRVIYDV
ncbi:MAG: hypothetical protein LBD46_06535 [Endomicrobium sp.]|jgi:hypothetical protein|nr:hypothetical protein [Endomicrobium sp.]